MRITGRERGLLALAVVCCTLPILMSYYGTVQRNKSVLWVDAGGYKHLDQAEIRSIKRLSEKIEKEDSINLIWADYTLSVKLKDGKKSFRLGAIGYNRKESTLLYRFTNPNLNTGFDLPTKLEFYSPISIYDIKELVRVKGTMNDIRRINPSVIYRVQTISTSKTHDETMK